MATLQIRPPTAQEFHLRFARHASTLLLIGFSVYYFADVLLRATEKYFWFDEIATFYLCRLNLAGIWHELKLGTDFNPPLFYFVTKASTAVFGPNLIGLRVPEIVSFWIVCVCLYRFVSRRAGVIAGAIAMVLPTLTGAFYYAYEARPHGIVLGFVGLALVCWQASSERPNSRWWLAGLSASLLGAALTHCYAVLAIVPFGIAELVRSTRYRLINPARWLALIAPCVIAIAAYIPLLLSYKKTMTGTDYASEFAPSIGDLAAFYGFLLGPCLVTAVSMLAILAVSQIISSKANYLEERDTGGLLRYEVVVGVSFFAMPILGLILAIVVHGPFFARYFVSALFGFSILIGLATGARRCPKWLPASMAVIVALPVVWQFVALVWHRHKGVAEAMVEPSVGYQLNVTLGGPLSRYPKLLSQPGDSRPIAIVQPLDFPYLLHYAPQLRHRIYYIRRAENDLAFIGFEHFHSWSPFTFTHALTREEFLRLSPDCLVLGVPHDMQQLAQMLQAGAALKSLQLSEGRERYLAELTTTAPQRQ